jgi:hypothetical protein
MKDKNNFGKNDQKIEQPSRKGDMQQQQHQAKTGNQNQWGQSSSLGNKDKSLGDKNLGGKNLGGKDYNRESKK